MIAEYSAEVSLASWLTRFADPDLLQIGLLDVGEVLQAGDVEAISDPQVELLQLDFGKELIEPLSVLVHHHVPAHLSLCKPQEDNNRAGLCLRLFHWLLKLLESCSGTMETRQKPSTSHAGKRAGSQPQCLRSSSTTLS